MKITDRYKESIMSYREAFLQSHDSLIRGSGELDQYDHYEDWKRWNQAHEHQETLPQGKIRSKQFLFIDESSKELIGMLNLRYELNAYLLAYGGHIGYSIHPDKRRHGMAVIMLREALNECKKLRLNHVLLVCNKENIASAKTITECGGVLEMR